jgi:hypothetical protein
MVWIPACAGMTTFYEGIKIDDLVRSQIYRFCHSGPDPESSNISMFWIPAFAGMTALVTFYEHVKIKRGIILWQQKETRLSTP